MFRCSIDLDDLSFEETHRKTLELKDCESGEITILLTVSGGTGHGEEIDGKTDGSNKSKRPRKYVSKLTIYIFYLLVYHSIIHQASTPNFGPTCNIFFVLIGTHMKYLTHEL